MNTSLFRLAAALGFMGVALGAFGAHGLKETLARNGMTGVWDKAVLYHLVHALALLVLAIASAVGRVVGSFWLLGIVLFSGSLYLFALTNIRWLVYLTPLGGICFLAGWLWLVLSPSGGKRTPRA